jgi:hypothetical protein
MANMIPISTVTVGSGGAASINFTGIPQTYTDLLVMHSLRSNSSQIYDILGLTFNGNVGNIYSTRNIRGNGATAISQSLTSQVKMEFELPNGNTSTASTFSNGQFYIPNYTSSNNKSASSEIVQETNATTAYIAMDAGLAATTAPISSMRIFPVVGSLWQQYSSATLYGIRKY